ncbi:MAG: AI-2E family transporter [Gammaproteobacteria bacterium]|nr:MAG: AI-2E family transporter [Gammaproteobacteria bacterium]
MIFFQNRPEIRAVGLFMVLVIPVLLLVWLLHSILFPIIIAAVLYMVMEPAISAAQSRGMNRSLAISVLLSVLIGLSLWLIVAVMPLMAEQLSILNERLPQTWENFSRFVRLTELWLAKYLRFKLESGVLLASLTESLRNVSSDVISTLPGWFADLAFWVVLVPFVTFFLLRDYRNTRNRMLNTVPNVYFERALAIYHGVATQLEVYVRGVMMQSAIMALLTGTGFYLIGLPMAYTLGLLAGIFNLIPYVGPILGLIPPLLVAFSIGADPNVVLWVVMTVLLAQLNDNVVVVPAVLARAANLHPLIALLAILVAGDTFGLLGMIFALPVLLTARIVFVGLYDGLQPIAQLGSSPD